jgi:hypothetical protein
VLGGRHGELAVVGANERAFEIAVGMRQGRDARGLQFLPLGQNSCRPDRIR